MYIVLPQWVSKTVSSRYSLTMYEVCCESMQTLSSLRSVWAKSEDWTTDSKRVTIPSHPLSTNTKSQRQSLKHENMWKENGNYSSWSLHTFDGHAVAPHNSCFLFVFRALRDFFYKLTVRTKYTTRNKSVEWWPPNRPQKYCFGFKRHSKTQFFSNFGSLEKAQNPRNPLRETWKSTPNSCKRNEIEAISK